MSERDVLLKGNGNSEKVSGMWDEIVRNYADKVIAVENGKIIETAKTAEDLIKSLENRNKDLSSISVISVPPANVAYIL